MSIENIAAKTIRTLKLNNFPLTPENYYKVFCQEAKNSGNKVEDCHKLEKFFGKLSDESKKLASSYNITTVDELVIFLISTINRSSNLKNDDYFHAVALLAKKLLTYLSTFPDYKISRLGKEGLKLDYKKYNRVMEHRAKWSDIIDNSSFDYINKLDKFGFFDKNDLPTLIDEIIINLEKDSDVKAVADLISELLDEISQEDGAPVGDLISELNQNPKVVTSKAVLNDVKNHFETYFNIKHKVLKKSSVDFKNAIDFYTETTSTLKENLNSHKKKIINFKDEILKSESKNLFGKLFGITQDIENSVDEMGVTIDKSEYEVLRLRKQIDELEASLSLERRKNDTDLLTTLLTRRKILSIATGFEENFRGHKKNYTVVFLKPKNYEQIGEEYGRFANDTVLASIGKFLKAKLANVGQIGRYNGNIFLILSSLNEDIVLKHLDELKKKVNSSKFMYEEERVPIEISYGIGQRKNFSTQKETFNKVFEDMRL